MITRCAFGLFALCESVLNLGVGLGSSGRSVVCISVSQQRMFRSERPKVCATFLVTEPGASSVFIVEMPLERSGLRELADLEFRPKHSTEQTVVLFLSFDF